MQQSRVTRKTLQVISFKIGVCLLHRRSKSKGIPPFQKVLLFLRYKIFHRDVTDLYFCLFEDVTDYCDILRRKKLCFDRTLLFATQ